jgi:hypothetical protein
VHDGPTVVLLGLQRRRRKSSSMGFTGGGRQVDFLSREGGVQEELIQVSADARHPGLAWVRWGRQD